MVSSFYFPHDCNARNDQRILTLRAEYGLEGYGLFFMALETLSEQPEGINRGAIGGLSLGYSYPKEGLIAFFDFCIEIGLFYEQNNMIRSSRMDDYHNKRKTFVDAGKKGAEKRWKNSPPNSPPNGKERRGEEKNSNSLKSSSHSTPNDEKNNPFNATKKATLEEKYRYFIDLFNRISDSETNGRWKRRFRGDSKSKRQFQARIKEGYTSADFERGIRKMYRDQFHRENNFKYATPELITRPDKLEKFINQ